MPLSTKPSLSVITISHHQRGGLGCVDGEVDSQAKGRTQAPRQILRRQTGLQQRQVSEILRRGHAGQGPSRHPALRMPTMRTMAPRQPNLVALVPTGQRLRRDFAPPGCRALLAAIAHSLRSVCSADFSELPRPGFNLAGCGPSGRGLRPTAARIEAR